MIPSIRLDLWRCFYFILDLLYLGLMLNEPRRGGQSTGRRWSAKHGTPAKSVVWTTTPKGWQNDNFIHFISLLCHPFGVVDFISSSSRGYAPLHHLPVVVPALRASLHNRLPYKINYSFVRHFHFRNLSNHFWIIRGNYRFWWYSLNRLQQIRTRLIYVNTLKF